MQQRRGGTAGHPGKTVGRAGHDALEQPKDAAHSWIAIQCGDEVHLRSAGVGETKIDIVGEQDLA